MCSRFFRKNHRTEAEKWGNFIASKGCNLHAWKRLAGPWSSEKTFLAWRTDRVIEEVGKRIGNKESCQNRSWYLRISICLGWSLASCLLFTTGRDNIKLKYFDRDLIEKHYNRSTNYLAGSVSAMSSAQNFQIVTGISRVRLLQKENKSIRGS